MTFPGAEQDLQSHNLPTIAIGTALYCALDNEEEEEEEENDEEEGQSMQENPHRPSWKDRIQRFIR